MKIIARIFLIALATFCFSLAAPAATFNVNTTADVQDAAPGDGICDNGGGGCSVRAAITEANALAGDDIINIPANTYNQTLNATDDDANAGGDWDITSNITINGSFGANSDLIGGATERVMEIVSPTAVVSMNGLTIAGGHKTGAPAAATRGGGIRNAGTLTITNCRISGNSASGGGGIRNERNLTLNGVSVQQNTCDNGGATCFGGGLYSNTTAAGSVITINNSLFEGNHSTSPGVNGFAFGAGMGFEGAGGFTVNISGSLIVDNVGTGNGTGGSNGNGIRLLATATSVVNFTNTTVRSNDGGATGGGASIQGSGVAIFTGAGGTGTLTGTFDRVTISDNFGNGGGVGLFVNGTSSPITFDIINSTISGNGGGTAGGGVALTNAGGSATSAVTLNFRNSTISSNLASNSGGGIFVEQPVAASAVTANFNFSTISNNTATTAGGGIFRSTAGTVNIKNSIVGNNTAPTGPEMAGTVNSQNYNQFESTTGATITGTTANDTTGDPNIGTLGNHGGPTQTHVPNIPGPVINAIPAGTNDCGTAVTNDQNLLPRPLGGACEKGSVERNPNAQHVMDFDGNGLTDWTVIRAGFLWAVLYNNNGQTSPFWTLSGDKFIPADFDGDGRTEVGVWRQSSNQFIAFSTAAGTIRNETFGIAGDDFSVTGDYDGDGKDDIAVWRPSNGTWYWRTTANGPVFAVQWGQPGDVPAPGDYDGDGKNDFVVRRDDGGGHARFWRVLSSGTTDTFVFGAPTDKIAPGDYDGDGKTDICIVRDKGGQLNWWVIQSSNSAVTVNAWGLNTDSITPGDYDGDGKTDRAIWRPDPNPDAVYFYVDRSFSGTLLTQEWGQQGDFPLGTYNVH
jgi:CSLREA domain-containing protein